MSVTGYMYNINAQKKLGELELEEGLVGNRSWHHQFKDSAYIYIGGLHPGLSEGDVVIVFSQFGEVVDCNLVRDRETGKPKGFAYICYEDQRSTILAVDNLNGYQLLKKTLRVDHCAKYKAPKEFDEDDVDEDGDPKLLEYKATGAEGAGNQVYNVIGSQKKINDVVKGRKAPAPFGVLEDEDEVWAKAFEQNIKSEMESDGKQRGSKEKRSLKKEKKSLKEMVKEAKRLKKETKELKKSKKDSKTTGKVKRQAKSSSSSSSKKRAKTTDKVKKQVKSSSSSSSDF